MINGYVVAFFPGTTGRFISSIVYRMKNNVDKIIELTEENSAHVNNDYCFHDAIKFPGAEHTPISFTYEKLFRYIHFLPYDKINVYTAHEPLNFADWSNNPNKSLFDTILITVDLESKTEIFGNILLKNTIPNLKAPLNKVGFFDKIALRRISRLWQRNFRTALTAEILEQPDNLHKLAMLSNNPKFLLFSSIGEIPEEFNNRVLELKYKELFLKDSQGNFVTLLKLAEYLNTDITDNIVKEYEKYAQGRDNLIKTKMPWLNSSS